MMKAQVETRSTVWLFLWQHKNIFTKCSFAHSVLFVRVHDKEHMLICMTALKECDVLIRAQSQASCRHCFCLTPSVLLDPAVEGWCFQLWFSSKALSEVLQEQGNEYTHKYSWSTSAWESILRGVDTTWKHVPSFSYWEAQILWALYHVVCKVSK